MSQPFIGQIQPFSFNFAPRNWAECNGQILGIAQNTALFSLLGTQYGGNGVTTFALPNLQSRVPNHAGSGFVQGESAGQEQVTLTVNNLPTHNHLFLGTTDNADSLAPADGAALATVIQPSGPGTGGYYASGGTPQPLNPGSISPVGGSQPHTNIQPYIAINWCICMFGVFPSRN